MLKIASRYGLKHKYQAHSRVIVRFLENSAHNEENELPKNARIVICGSGLAGSSLAYHLAECDLGRHVVMLERGSIDITHFDTEKLLTSSGLVGSFKHSDLQVRLGQYSIKLLDKLTQQGFDLGWNQCGSLHLARTSDRMLQYRKMKTQSESWNIRCQLMSPEECKEKLKIIKNDDIKGGLYVADDGKTQFHI